MQEIISECCVTFDEYKELNPLLAEPNPEYEKSMMLLQSDMVHYILSLFG